MNNDALLKEVDIFSYLSVVIGTQQISGLFSMPFTTTVLEINDHKEHMLNKGKKFAHYIVYHVPHQMELFGKMVGKT